MPTAPHAPTLIPRAPHRKPSVEQAIRLRWTGIRIASELKLGTATVSWILRRAVLRKLGSLTPSAARGAL